MVSQQFGPVTLANIARGSPGDIPLAEKLDLRLADVAKKLVDYVMENGIDLTKKAKAEVTLKITFMHVEQGIFTVGGIVSDKVPSQPPSVGRLVLESGTLMSPLSEHLTPQDDPRQRTFDHTSAKEKAM